MHMIQNHIIFWNDAQHDHHKFTQIKRILRNKSPNKIYLTNSNVQWSGWMERWVLVNGQLDILNSVMMLQTRWCKHWCKKNLVRESSSLYLHILQAIWEESRSRYAKQEAVYQKNMGIEQAFSILLKRDRFLLHAGESEKLIETESRYAADSLKCQWFLLETSSTHWRVNKMVVGR